MWKVRNSKIHGTGIFATKDIKKNTRIIEYVGEKITRSEGDKDLKKIKSIWTQRHRFSLYF